jgi:hypothetical protein
MAGILIVAVPSRAFPDILVDGDSAHRRALDFLKELPREWSGASAKDCKTYEPKNIERLSRPFAAAAANFLRAFVEIHGAVTLTSAHRTAQEQACVCLGERGPCAGKRRVLKTKKRDGASSSKVGCHTISLGLRLMFAPELAAMTSSSACTSSPPLIRSSQSDFHLNSRGIEVPSTGPETAYRSAP